MMSGNKSDNSVVDEEFVEVPEKTMEEEPESQPISCAEGTLRMMIHLVWTSLNPFVA